MKYHFNLLVEKTKVVGIFLSPSCRLSPSMSCGAANVANIQKDTSELIVVVKKK